MSLKINTNVAALNAHRNMLRTDGGLSKSLERLSSGLRINKAADDASGMAIADSLKAQALGLGQAISNANDAVSVIQTADGALEESINIVNNIRTKALQASSDGQNSDSRSAIQRDINKLLGSLNNIADTTAFNGQTLLKGDFQNKFFQVGAYANQTINVSIANADASHVGKLASIETTSTQTALTNVDTDSNFVARTAADLGDNIFAQVIDADLALNGYAVGGNLAGQGVEQLSAEGVAAAINHMTGDTNVTATAETTWTGSGSIAGGSIADGALVINGTNIGPVSVVANDADGALESAINAHTGSTGVSASVSSTGVLTLTSADGSNIALYNGGTYASNSFTNTLGSGFTDNRSVTQLTATYSTAGTKEINIGGHNYSFVASSDDATTQDNLFDAIDTELGSDYTVTQTGGSGGVVVITRTDGNDINFVSDSDGTYASMSAQLKQADGSTNVGSASVNDSLIGNNSQHGTVTLTSDTNISLTGDAQTMASYGFNAATSQTEAASGGIIDADVTSFSAAQITVQRADSALTSLDTIRSQLGSAQNQVESTIRNITVTQVNVTSAESGIRDVDFAAESANFAKFQVLSQSGSFAMAQANATLQNVLRLLQ